ncbi:MAG: threonine synthase, partial [Candidatus Sedimenticola sp. 20ELBAFRAG]
RGLMEQMATEGKLEVPQEKRAEVESIFVAAAVSEEETLEQIKQTYAECGYILDPHTAVGVKAGQAYPDAVCLATAHPAKFGDAVNHAIGIEAPPPPSLQGLMEKEARCEVLDADGDVIRQYMKDTLAAK